MKRKFAIALCAFAITVPGIAQQQGGGFPGGGQAPRMGPGMGRMGGPNILMAPDVQKELNLSEDQKARLGKLFVRQNGGGPGGPPPQGGFGGPGGPGGPPLQGGGQGGPGGPPLQGGPGGNREEMEKRGAEMDAKIKAILDDTQYTRFHELTLQQRGASALLERKVSDKVALTQDQRKQIQTIMEENRPTPPQPGGGGQLEFEKMRQEMDARQKSINEKILAVLTSDQKSTWNKMLGKPFTFKRNSPPQGGRGGNG